jgi:hypothetical protein
LRECPLCHRGRMFTVEILAGHRSGRVNAMSVTPAIDTS